jgi:hypothetical protein
MNEKNKEYFSEAVMESMKPILSKFDKLLAKINNISKKNKKKSTEK